MNTKKNLFILGIILIIFTLGIGLCIGMKGEDEDEIKVEIMKVAPTRLLMTYQMELNDKHRDCKFYTSEKFEIEKWTLVGWKHIDMKYNVTSAKKIELVDSVPQQWSITLYSVDGPFSIGLYRIHKNVSVENIDGSYEVGSEPLELQYKTPFLVASWWEILLLFIIVAFAVGIICFFCRPNTWSEFKSKFVKRKKTVFIFCVMFCALIVGYLCFLYYYERDGVQEMGFSASINLQEATMMQIHHNHYWGTVKREAKAPSEDEKTISLSMEQRNQIVDVFQDKMLQPYGRLWYRYDAVITYNGEVMYKIDLKNKFVFMDKDVAMSKSILRPTLMKGYIELTEEENQVLKQIITGDN